jgi:sarcosine oxidase subunit beta
MRASGVELRERTAFKRVRPSRDGGLTVETGAGAIEAERVLLTGGPALPAVGALAGSRIPSGGTRHTVCVTEPREEFAVERMAMVFDIGAGLYFRLDEGGLLYGYSNPDEPPGIAREIDWAFHKRMRDRLAELAPMTRDLALRKLWVATIDFTPDHFPIVGPALDNAGAPIEGVTVASAGGHGMMWGPAVARVAADLALEGRTSLVDVADLGLDRFDAAGRSRLTPDPIALPFPPSAGE